MSAQQAERVVFITGGAFTDEAKRFLDSWPAERLLEKPFGVEELKGVVERSIMRDPRLVGVDLTGTTLVEADSYGKHLFVRFDANLGSRDTLMVRFSADDRSTGGVLVGA